MAWVADVLCLILIDMTTMLLSCSEKTRGDHKSVFTFFVKQMKIEIT